LIPNMSVWRPCDAVETAVAWRYAVENHTGPTSLLLSRQGLPHMVRTGSQLSDIARGGYILKDCGSDQPDAIIIATGSEVELAVKAAGTLTEKGRKIRVVSMPSTDVFEAQDQAYREKVLPTSVTARVVVEAGVTGLWHKYAGCRGKVIGLDRFGESAPAGQLFNEFGFTVENVVSAVEVVLG
jgi:transketolase